MPELPEVETIRRQLEPELRNQRIERLEVLDARWTRPVDPRQVEEQVNGRRIESLRRRGKYLLMGLEDGVTLVMHLRMTGNLLLINESDLVAAVDESAFARTGERYLRARFSLDDGRELWFSDARRFGEAFVLATDRIEERFAGRVGIEPFSAQFTAEAIERLAAGRRAPLKSFLLDQAGIAGVGNIYADEALWRAELHPLSPAGSMRHEHAEALREGVIEALRAGIDEGGASVDDYVDARGARGSMQDEFIVHDREGETCPRCGDTIRRIVVSGRSTYFSPGCQVRLRRRPRRRRPHTAAQGAGR
ncbi:MAG: bifunctional DNA-formamidopyrimidine glycosylase/DNA-(apurinic or apyrimidinic site) lyase [Actinomycetota bacterium]|nr:bifunctional DNA-formamidopyrimidine glycosylase/DNA-(apurinic or apyrimidinic site) lyase [Actinomycetota bacterium]